MVVTKVTLPSLDIDSTSELSCNDWCVLVLRFEYLQAFKKSYFLYSVLRLSVKFYFFAVVSWVLALIIVRQPEIAYAKAKRFLNLSNKGKYKNILTNKMNNFSNGFRSCLIGTVAGVSDIRLKGRRFVSTLENQKSCLVGTCGSVLDMRRHPSLVVSSKLAGLLVLKYTCAVVRFAQLAETMSEKANTTLWTNREVAHEWEIWQTQMEG